MSCQYRGQRSDTEVSFTLCCGFEALWLGQKAEVGSDKIT